MSDAPGERPIEPGRAIRPRDLAHPVVLLACGLGSGLAPRAPGTAGTLVGVAVWFPLAHAPLAWYLGVVALLFAAGVALCRAAGRRLGDEDHPGIVFDEIVGYLVAMIAVPATWQAALAGFVLFRVFDILKPWPVSLADARVGGGLGVMLDDVLAGGYALVCLQVVHRVL